MFDLSSELHYHSFQDPQNTASMNYLDFNLQAAIGLLQRRKKQRKKQNLRFVTNFSHVFSHYALCVLILHPQSIDCIGKGPHTSIYLYIEASQI